MKASNAKVLKRPAAKNGRPRRRAVDSLVAKLAEVNWVPLESNPDMLNVFARHIGLPEEWRFVDVLGVDAEFLSMVPRPVLGVTLLFQCSEKLLEHNYEQQTLIKKSGQKLKDDTFFMKQYVGNACGTIAAIHCIANSAEKMGVASDSAVGQLLTRTRGLSPEEIGAQLADMEEFHLASDESAAGGQTEAPEAEEDTDHHFISFVAVDGDIYELDGAKPFPINHGPAGDDMLEAVANVIKAEFMEKDPGNIHFNVMALVKSTEDADACS